MRADVLGEDSNHGDLHEWVIKQVAQSRYNNVPNPEVDSLRFHDCSVDPICCLTRFRLNFHV